MHRHFEFRKSKLRFVVVLVAIVAAVLLLRNIAPWRRSPIERQALGASVVLESMKRKDDHTAVVRLVVKSKSSILYCNGPQIGKGIPLASAQSRKKMGDNWVWTIQREFQISPQIREATVIQPVYLNRPETERRVVFRFDHIRSSRLPITRKAGSARMTLRKVDVTNSPPAWCEHDTQVQHGHNGPNEKWYSVSIDVDLPSRYTSYMTKLIDNRGIGHDGIAMSIEDEPTIIPSTPSPNLLERMVAVVSRDKADEMWVSRIIRKRHEELDQEAKEHRIREKETTCFGPLGSSINDPSLEFRGLLPLEEKDVRRVRFENVPISE